MTSAAIARRGASALVAFLAMVMTSSLATAATTLPATLPARHPASDDIRDIRGPIAIPIWWHVPLAIALVVIAGVGVGLAVRAWRRRRALPLTPLELARRALVVAEEHARQGRSHAWAELVAETTRGALAVRLGTEVLPQTTLELASAAWTKPPMAEAIDAPSLLDLLTTCDLARFANARFEPSVLIDFTARAGEVVERLFNVQSKPVTVVAAEPRTVSP
jgi:hypothetical protein